VVCEVCRGMEVELHTCLTLMVRSSVAAVPLVSLQCDIGWVSVSLDELGKEKDSSLV
jgi:hypothetical protein